VRCCDAILDGYETSLKEGGCPFVLAGHEKNLEGLGLEAIKPPQDFWKILLRDPIVSQRQIPPDARKSGFPD
jgi:hypothetical protein